jgi:hypothetical protein
VPISDRRREAAEHREERHRDRIDAHGGGEPQAAVTSRHQREGGTDGPSNGSSTTNAAGWNAAKIVR